MEYCIYPSKDDLKEAAANYLEEEQEEFFNSMSEAKWNTYFKKNIESLVNNFNFNTVSKYFDIFLI